MNEPSAPIQVPTLSRFQGLLIAAALQLLVEQSEKIRGLRPHVDDMIAKFGIDDDVKRRAEQWMHEMARD